VVVLAVWVWAEKGGVKDEGRGEYRSDLFRVGGAILARRGLFPNQKTDRPTQRAPNLRDFWRSPDFDCVYG